MWLLLWRFYLSLPGAVHSALVRGIGFLFVKLFSMRPKGMIQKVKLRVPGEYDADAASLAHGLEFEGEGLTIQSAGNDQDINTIVRRFGVTREAPPAPRVLAEYGDFTGVSDLHQAMNEVRAAQESFDALPAELRARFGNDPRMLWSFLQDEGNDDEAVKLGLLKAREKPVLAPPAVVEAPAGVRVPPGSEPV